MYRKMERRKTNEFVKGTPDKYGPVPRTGNLYFFLKKRLLFRKLSYGGSSVLLWSNWKVNFIITFKILTYCSKSISSPSK